MVWYAEVTPKQVEKYCGKDLDKMVNIKDKVLIAAFEDSYSMGLMMEYETGLYENKTN